MVKNAGIESRQYRLIDLLSNRTFLPPPLEPGHGQLELRVVGDLSFCCRRLHLHCIRSHHLLLLFGLRVPMTPASLLSPGQLTTQVGGPSACLVGFGFLFSDTFFMMNWMKFSSFHQSYRDSNRLSLLSRYSFPENAGIEPRPFRFCSNS